MMLDSARFFLPAALMLDSARFFLPAALMLDSARFFLPAALRFFLPAALRFFLPAALLKQSIEAERPASSPDRFGELPDRAGIPP